MSFWKSNVSKVFVFFLAGSLMFSFGSYAQETKTEEDHTKATVSLQVTLSGVKTYSDFLEIRTALTKAEGVERVTLASEAPGFITFQVRYAGEVRSLIEKLEAFFPKKYQMVEKSGSGGSELSISR